VDEVNRAREVTEYASGKGINVARVLTQLGEAASAAGFSGGRRGEFLIEDCARWNVSADFVRTAGETRLCTTIIDRTSNTVTELVEEAPPASHEEWAELIRRIEARLAAAKCLIFSGTQARNGPEDFCDRWAGKGPRVIVDTQGPALLRALATPTCIVKLNRQELSLATKRSLDDERTLTEQIPSLVPAEGLLVVTMGKAGAIGSDGDRVWRVRVPAIKPVNPIGSGDAFSAGMAAALVRGEPIERWLALGAACGVANALTPLAGTVRREDVERLLGEVVVENV
jgi:tagatose 6-phosphate kinase